MKSEHSADTFSMSMKDQGHRTLRVGVTGGIGSGKSVACAMFRDLGIRIFEADCVSKRLMETDSTLRERIISEFGTSSYRNDGTLDRAALAQVVFNDPRRRKKLEAIVHPRVRKEIDDFFTGGTDNCYAIVEAALVYESGLDGELDYVIVVDAEEKMRIERTLSRDGGSRQDVRRRIGAQISAAEKRKKADFTVMNNGTLDELRSRVLFLHTLLSGLAKRPMITSREHE